MSTRAKNLTGAVLSLAFAMVFAAASFGQSGHPVEGTYNVTATSEALGTLSFLMTLKKDGGKWTGEIKDSPTPLNVTSVAVDESNKVTVVADAAGTAVTIGGQYADNKIDGDWSAGDIKGKWKAERKGAMAAAGAAMMAKPSATAADIAGSYDVAANSEAMGTMSFVMVLKNDGGKWSGEVKDSPTPLNVTSVTVDHANKVTVVADAGGTAVTIVGQYADNKIIGDWSAGDIKGKWEAKKKK